MTPDKIRAQLAEYIGGYADSRENAAADFPDDVRNRRAADALHALAAAVLGVPDDDPLITQLGKLSDATGLDVFELMPADEATVGVSASKFRFHDPREPEREFLERLVDGAEAQYVDVHMSELDKQLGPNFGDD